MTVNEPFYEQTCLSGFLKTTLLSTRAIVSSQKWVSPVDLPYYLITNSSVGCTCWSLHAHSHNRLSHLVGHFPQMLFTLLRKVNFWDPEQFYMLANFAIEKVISKWFSRGFQISNHIHLKVYTVLNTQPPGGTITINLGMHNIYTFLRCVYEQLEDVCIYAAIRIIYSYFPTKIPGW